MRIIGLDVGKKTIGVAVSDEAGIIAQPVVTVKRKNYRADVEEVLRHVDEYGAGEIVVGMPVNMDGTRGESADLVDAFIGKLREKTAVPIATWDERLSTAAVTRVLLEGDVSRSRRKEVVDKLAAAYILQGYLDSRRPRP